MRNGALEPDRCLVHVRHVEVRVGLHAATPEHRGGHLACRIRIPWVEHQEIALGTQLTGDAQRLIVQVGFVPVVEHPIAATNGGTGARTVEREADTRHQVHRIAHMRLELLADADAERKAPIQPEIVLTIDAELVLRKRRLKLPEPLRECVRRAGQERL